MFFEQVSAYAQRFPEVTEDQPYGPGALVYKVAGKTFAILEEPKPGGSAQVTLKCEPALALELRAQFPAVGPGYHTNKEHWNTVVLDGSVPSEEIEDMIGHSFDRVAAGLPKAVRTRLAAQRGA